MAVCKDKYGNYVDCETLKALKSENWKASDDRSKGTEMREVYKPKKVTRKDASVYDKLQKEIDSGFAKAKYNFTGKDLNEYIKAKNTVVEYRNPSKNQKQNESLEMIKRGGTLLTSSNLIPRTIQTLNEDNSETSTRKGETKKVTIDKGKGKTFKPNKRKRKSLFNTTSKKDKSRKSLYKCKKKGCVAKGERSIKRHLKKRR